LYVCEKDSGRKQQSAQNKLDKNFFKSCELASSVAQKEYDQLKG
jgi:hypothetical protein